VRKGIEIRELLRKYSLEYDNLQFFEVGIHGVSHPPLFR
jgi:hypothetical protein